MDKSVLDGLYIRLSVFNRFLKNNYKPLLFREFRIEAHLTEYLTGSINTILCVSLQKLFVGRKVNECVVDK